MKDDRFDLDGELRAGRSRPRAEFATALARDVRRRVRQGRIGLTLALAGLMIVAVASFGGVGYASSSKSAVAKHSATSAAAAQYKPFTPKQTTQVKGAPHAQAAAQVQKAAPKATTSSQLPFTGLALWVPVAIGLLLIALGLVVRTRARRHGSGAH